MCPNDKLNSDITAGCSLLTYVISGQIFHIKIVTYLYFFLVKIDSRILVIYLFYSTRSSKTECDHKSNNGTRSLTKKDVYTTLQWWRRKDRLSTPHIQAYTVNGRLSLYCIFLRERPLLENNMIQ